MHLYSHLSEGSLKLASDGAETGRSLPFPSSNFPNTFAFKLQDKRGRMHRFTCSMLLVPVAYQITVCVFIFVCVLKQTTFFRLLIQISWLSHLI